MTRKENIWVFQFSPKPSMIYFLFAIMSLLLIAKWFRMMKMDEMIFKRK
jgi:hypothetical protein